MCCRLAPSTVPLDDRFFAAVAPLLDPGMGTECVGPLLYALVRMRRPRRVLAVGLGYSTPFILQALVDNAMEARRDADVLSGLIRDPGRAAVLDADYDHRGHDPYCIGIDDFEHGCARRAALQRCIADLSFGTRFEMRVERFERTSLTPVELPVALAWIDAGHQLDYAGLVNRAWPMIDPDGGLLALHYSHIDVGIPCAGGVSQAMIAGPVANAMRRQQLEAGIGTTFEVMALLEPHKRRQGSVLIAHRLEAGDLVRESALQDEQGRLYGRAAESLCDLNGQQPGAERPPDARAAALHARSASNLMPPLGTLRSEQ